MTENERIRIGEFLRERGLLSQAQIEQILVYQKDHTLRFGEAAQKLGFIAESDLYKVFGPKNSVDFFHLNPSLFPQVTKDLLSVPQILKYGVLPLGTKTEYRFFMKRRSLNLGWVDPPEPEEQKTLLDEIRKRNPKVAVSHTRPYLVLPEQMLDVLTQAYQTRVDPTTAQTHEIHPRLAMTIL
jgi:hypothetical protein